MLHRPDDIRRTARDIQRLEIVTALDLLCNPAPPRRWCVPDLVPDREVTLISGDGGIGKSTVAIQLCAASVSCLLWFGLDVRQGAALYVSCEDDIDEIHLRLEQIQRNEPHACFDGLHILSLAGEDAIMAAARTGSDLLQPTPLFQQIEQEVAARKIRLLVLDAAADVFGGNEVSRSQTRAFIRMLRGLAIRNDCTVVLLAHPSVDGMKTGRGYAGSTAWNNSVRSRLYFTRATASDDSEPDADLRVLELAKSNRSRAGQRIMMRWHDGCFVLDGAQTSDIERLTGEMRAETIFLELLDERNRQDRPVSDKPGANFAPSVFAENPAAHGISKKSLRAAMDRLFTADRIRIVESGPPSRTLRRIVRGTAA